jgi:hypothetical protein
MAKFMFLFRGGNISPDQMDAQMQAWGAWIGKLHAEGLFVDGAPFTDEGKVVCATRGTMDLPAADDTSNGYVVITAADLSTATVLTAGCPIFNSGGFVEVRELKEMTM